MNTYKVPSDLPQDLLLIRDLVGEDNDSTPAPVASRITQKRDQDSIDSSSDEGTDSEDEVEANLLSTGDNADEKPQTLCIFSQCPTS
jgi:hypothetical protein